MRRTVTVYLRGSMHRPRADGPRFLLPEQVEVINVSEDADIFADEAGLTIVQRNPETTQHFPWWRVIQWQSASDVRREDPK